MHSVDKANKLTTLPDNGPTGIKLNYCIHLLKNIGCHEVNVGL